MIAAIMIGRSATYLVKALIPIGQHFKISEFAISFLLMAFATSLPELFVGVLAATQHTAELAIGTIIGSNIADLTVVMGISAIVAGTLRVRSIIKKKDIIYMSGITFILILLLLDGSLSRPDSFILLMIYGYYIYRLFTQKKKFESKAVSVSNEEFMRSLGILIASIIGLIISAELIVWSAEQIADTLSIPLTLIGIVVVAFGTSLPELSFEITAIKNKHHDMVLGDVIGSVVTNSALVIGIIGLINPVNSLDLGLINTGLMILAFVTFVALYFVKNDSKLTMREGIALMFIYVCFIFLEYLVKMIGI